MKPLCPRLAFRFLLVLLVFDLTACDSAGDHGGDGDFEEAEPGVLVGQARMFTWSADGERLYHAVDEDIVGEGGVITGTRYWIYETTPGDSPQLIVEDSTDTSSLEAAVYDLAAAGDVLYFFVRNTEPSNTGRILRRSPGEATPEAVVVGAFDPQERVANVLSLSANGRYLAYYAGEGLRPDSFEIRVRDLDKSTDIHTEVVTSDYVGGPRDIPLLLSRDGSRLLHGFSASSPVPDGLLTVVDLATGEAQAVQLTDPNGPPSGSSHAQGVQFYASADHFVAVYSVEDGSRQTVVTYPLPAGTPRPIASFQREHDGWIADYIYRDATPDSYAFWRIEHERGLCAVHAIDLSRGEERRVAAPIPNEGAFSCAGFLAIAPGERRVAYQAPSADINRDLYVANLPN